MEQHRMKLPLFDDYWIDFRIGTTRRWFAPEPMGAVPGGPYSSLIYVPEDKKYRIYYEQVVSYKDDDCRVLMCQQSEDLIHFEPLLNDEGGPIIYDGEFGLHGTSVLYDPLDKDPSRRYKLCGMFGMDRAKKGESPDWMGVEIAFSPDGIHFTRHPECKVFNQTSDALNKLCYNPLDGKYTVFHRAGFVDRRISITRSEDLIHWSRPRIILQPSTNYNDGFTGMQHYSMTGNYFDGIFYGLVWRYNTSLYDKDFSRMFGFMDTELVYSYDGEEYLYTSGKNLMERPYYPQPGCCGLSPDDMCESADGQSYYILCFGYNKSHGNMKYNIRVTEELRDKNVKLPSGQPLYKIRKDGFCGIESIGDGGLVITKCLALMKDDLSFNIRANLGTARFGIMDMMGNYLEGFSLEDSIPFEYDDSVDVKPQWKEHQLSEVLNKRVRIVVELNTAMLHCITATARPYVRQMQESFAHPEAIIDPALADSVPRKGLWGETK